MLKKIAFSTLLTSSLLLAESGAGLNLNNDDLEIEGVLDSRDVAALQTSSTVFQADLNFMNATDNQKLFGAGIGATNKFEGVEGVELTFGAKFVWADLTDDNFSALPLMAKVRYSLPPLMYNIPQVAFEGKVLYAPDALSFGDSKRYREFRFSGDIEIIENVKLYAGYRNIHTGYGSEKDYVFDNSYFAGIKMSY